MWNNPFQRSTRNGQTDNSNSLGCPWATWTSSVLYLTNLSEQLKYFQQFHNCWSRRWFTTTEKCFIFANCVENNFDCGKTLKYESLYLFLKSCYCFQRSLIFIDKISYILCLSFSVNLSYICSSIKSCYLFSWIDCCLLFIGDCCLGFFLWSITLHFSIRFPFIYGILST